ncbi:hypothetical protein [Phytohabitans rumicis]|uniref:Uncharacterized protein n=1 Tax=Phytohabitans rumicis TaxID=1076125 RepID=A0A6V8LEC0_9ACTN|nr:hypothetical protein [Phytohabitans rumicis]GFJ92436.1 hypothetical protein Prum_060780 [Phytohabitans rumicis]
MSASPIFVVAANNTAFHVYRDAQSVVDTKEFDADQLASVEFFDVNGRRLTPVLSDTGTLMGLSDAGGQSDVPAVQARLAAVRQHLAATVDKRITKAAPPTVTSVEALSRLPVLDGRPLAECYVLLEPIFGHAYGGVAGTRHDGSWWHNFWAH